MIDLRKIILFSFLFTLVGTPGFATSGENCDYIYLWCIETVCPGLKTDSSLYKSCKKKCEKKKDKCIKKAECDQKFRECEEKCGVEDKKCYKACEKKKKRCIKKAEKDK